MTQATAQSKSSRRNGLIAAIGLGIAVGMVGMAVIIVGIVTLVTTMIGEVPAKQFRNNFIIGFYVFFFWGPLNLHFIEVASRRPTSPVFY